MQIALYQEKKNVGSGIRGDDSGDSVVMACGADLRAKPVIK